jgi:hypothetical protein
MSHLHIHLTKLFQDEKIIQYKITTPDFSDKNEGVYFGIIEIDLKSGKFTHKENALWEKNKIYPIYLLGLPPEELKLLSITKFKEYSSGMYAREVFNFINKSIESDNFPDDKLIIH